MLGYTSPHPEPKGPIQSGFQTISAHSSIDSLYYSAKVCGAYFGVLPTKFNGFGSGQSKCPSVIKCLFNKSYTDLALHIIQLSSWKGVLVLCFGYEAQQQH